MENRSDRKTPATVVKIGMTWAGKKAIDEIAALYGMKQQEAAGRIYEWFVVQDSITQRAVMGLLEGLEVDAAARFMEQFGKGEAKMPDFLASYEYGQNGGAKTETRPPGPSPRKGPAKSK